MISSGANRHCHVSRQIAGRALQASGGPFVRPWSSSADAPGEKGGEAHWDKSGSAAVSGGMPPGLTATPQTDTGLHLGVGCGQDQRKPASPGRPAGHRVSGDVQQVDLQTLVSPLDRDQCASDTLRWQRHANDVSVVSQNRALGGSGGKVRRIVGTYFSGVRPQSSLFKIGRILARFEFETGAKGAANES